LKNRNWWFRFQLIVVTSIFALGLGAGIQAHAADDTPSNIAVVKMSLDNSMVQLDTPIAEAYTLDGQKSDIPFWGRIPAGFHFLRVNYFLLQRITSMLFHFIS